MVDSIDYEEFFVEGGNGMVLEAYEKIRKYQPPPPTTIRQSSVIPLLS